MKKLLLPLILLLFACSDEDPALEFPLEVEEEYSSEIFFSEYIEGSSFNKAFLLYTAYACYDKQYVE